MSAILPFTRAVLSHGEDVVKVNALSPEGRPTSITEEVKIGYIKFDNGSRIIAFSSNPYAMAVYGGDVGLDEFAKHPNARLLWQTAQARVTWNYDLSVWSSHDGEDTLFNQFVQQARAACSRRGDEADSLSALGRGLGEVSHPLSETSSSSSLAELKRSEDGSSISVPDSDSLEEPSLAVPLAHPVGPRSAQRSPELGNPSGGGLGEPLGSGVRVSSPIEIQKSKIENPSSPWNVYFRVTMPDAIELGLLDVINRTQDSSLDPEQFLADCRSRAGTEEIFQQSYMCNPMGAETNHIVDWSAIERCRFDYEIIRVHLEHAQIIEQFGPFSPASETSREYEIEQFIHKKFLKLFQTQSTYRLGFDVAASGQGDLAVIYIDERKGDALWLRGLFSCRTEDWNFLQTVLFKFLTELRSVSAAGDSSGLGQQICWEANQHFGGRFKQVNFASKKHDLGFALMNQLASAQKRFPTSEQDIAADFFALRKSFQGKSWSFSESRNHLNPASHCDIAWAGALATHAHLENRFSAGGIVI